MPNPVPVTVGELVERLGEAGLRLVSGAPDTPLAPGRWVLFDPLVPLEPVPDGLLLGVGVDPRTDVEVVRAAAAAGYAALVVRDLGPPGDAVVEAATRHGLALAAVDTEVGWLHLEGLLSSVLAALDGELGRLGRPGTGQDLFDLANATAVLVGGAVTIEDLQQKLLAYSTVEGQRIDEDRRAGILGRQVPVLPENDDQYAAVFAAPGAVRIEGVGDAMDRLAVAVRAGQQPLGSIWVVDADGDLGPDAALALERSAELAALHMLQLRSSADLARQQRAGLLRRLLAGGGEASLALDRLGLDPAGPFAVLALAASLGDGDHDELRMGRFVGMVEAHCSGLRPAATTAVLDSTVYVCAAGALAEDRGRLAATARMLVDRGAFLGVPVRAGLGSTVTRAESVSRSREEADLLLLLPVTEAGPVATVEESRSQLSLLSLAEHLRGQPRLVSRPARRIREHDARHGTDYAETVLAWFEHQQSPTATSAALSVHPNTLRYRLQRIRELFEIDLDRPDDLLMLWLGLRVGVLDPAP